MVDFKNLGSAFGNLGDLFSQATKLRDEIQRLQAAMASRTVEASAGAGMVKVTANGKQEILSVSIDPELVKLSDREMLQDLVKAGVNQALKASQDMAAEEMKKLTGGFSLSSLLSMFKGS